MGSGPATRLKKCTVRSAISAGDGRHDALLQHAQRLGLHSGAHVADLVK
jgi:hypothetical protein